MYILHSKKSRVYRHLAILFMNVQNQVTYKVETLSINYTESTASYIDSEVFFA